MYLPMTNATIKNTEAMKKVLLIVCFLVIGFTSFSQVLYFRSYQHCFKESGRNWSSWTSDNVLIKIDVDNDFIKIYNQMGSEFHILYSTAGYDGDGNYVLNCSAVDEEGIDCNIRITTRTNGQSQMYIDYIDVTVCYNITNVN